MARATKATGTAPRAGGAWLDRLRGEVERLAGGTLERQRLENVGAALASLHRRFVSENQPEPTAAPYLADRLSLAAYLAYFVPASTAQVARALAEVAPPATKVLRVLDVGSGPGPASFAVAQWARVHGRTVDVVALEPAAPALATFAKVWDASWGPLATRAWKVGEALPAGSFDVIVASHVLNELFLEEQARLDRRSQLTIELAKKLAPGGQLVLVEPALRRTGRELLVVRDRLVSAGFPVLAPCLFQGACPAIARPRDWCHADRPWALPEMTEAVGVAAGLRRESLKFSYVIHTNVPVDAERAKDPSLFRIVSEPLPEKGKLRYFGCGGAGRQPLVRLEREVSDANLPFSTLERGDIVRVEGTVASGDGKRVVPAVAVRIERSARDLDANEKA